MVYSLLAASGAVQKLPPNPENRWVSPKMPHPLEAWQRAVAAMADELPPMAFAAWIEPLTAEGEGGGLRVLCPSAFHCERVRERYLERLQQLLSEHGGASLRVVLAATPKQRSPHAPPPPGGPPRRTAARGAHPANQAKTRNHPPRSRRVVTASGEGRRRGKTRSSPAPFTFSTFVVGPANALAREASLAVARGRQLATNPLVLAGATGLGKSHLAQAIVSEAASADKKRALLVSAEQFTSEFAAALRERRIGDFKRRYRETPDVLVVEDVEFLAGKRATQLELFHTLESIQRRGGRVVVTCQRLPREIPDLNARLASRMAGGLCAELETPDIALRREILRAKAAAGAVRVPDACLELLASSVQGSVRDLESSLIQVVASASLLKQPIDLELTRSALRKVGGPPPRELLEAERVARVVADFFGVTPEALASPSRRRDVLRPRQLAMYLCHRYTPASHERIGRIFNRQHTSVRNAIRVVERGILERARLRYQVEALAARLEALLAKTKGRGLAAPPAADS